MPRVSVLLPNYNHAPYLRQRIQSVLDQTFTDFELLILDDTSTDDSRQVISEYVLDPRVSTAFNDVNSGSPYLQWRKGLSLTSGEYVWIAESDDFADPTLLARLVEQLDLHTQAGIATCDSWRVDANGERLGRYSDMWRENPVFADYDLSFLDKEVAMAGRSYCGQYMAPWNTIPNASAVVFRRAAFDAIGGPVTEMKLCGDWLTYCKMLMQFGIVRIPEALNHFRYHAISVRRRTKSIEFVRESMAVHAYVADQLGLGDRYRRSVRVREFFSHALIAAERDPQRKKVPIGRFMAVAREAAQFGPLMLGRTLRILVREQLIALARSVGHRR